MTQNGTPHNSGATANINGILPIWAYADAEHRQPYNIVPLLLQGANTLHIRDAIAGAYGIIEKGYGKIYHRTRRLLLKLQKQEIVTSERKILFQGWAETPSIWWRLTLKHTNLIKQVQNSNRQEKAQIPPANQANDSEWYWARFPKRANPERITACKLLRNIETQKNHWLWQRESKTAPLRPELTHILDCIKKPYERYISMVQDTAIVLCPYGMETKLDQATLQFLPYKTRFTAIDRQLNNLDRYKALWEESKQYYDEAVFLTLTTAPAKHQTLWHANRHFAKAWNRYMALLTKRNRKAAKKNGTYDDELSYRPRYICVYEFQKNGLLHCHAILFGIDKIANDRQISEDWDRCGQGSITKQIPLKLRDNQWGWKHQNQRPPDAAKDESPERYLKKYLEKAIHGHQDFELYWAINKRFLSSSRTLSPYPQPRPRREHQEDEPAGYIKHPETGEEIPYYNEKPPEPEPLTTKFWTYVGTFRGGIVPDWLLRKIQTRKPAAAKHGDGELDTPGNTKRWWNAKPKHPEDREETPNPQTKPPETDTEDAYKKQLEIEREQRRKRREELRKRKTQSKQNPEP